MYSDIASVRQRQVTLRGRPSQQSLSALLTSVVRIRKPGQARPRDLRPASIFLTGWRTQASVGLMDMVRPLGLTSVCATSWDIFRLARSPRDRTMQWPVHDYVLMGFATDDRRVVYS